MMGPATTSSACRCRTSRSRPLLTAMSISVQFRQDAPSSIANPRTGRPGEQMPDGWDEIPGARGCTPQSCSFRDHYRELADLGAGVFGLSTQSTAEQREVERLHLPFELLSDGELRFSRALRLPTFKAAGLTLIKHLT